VPIYALGGCAHDMHINFASFLILCSTDWRIQLLVRLSSDILPSTLLQERKAPALVKCISRNFESLYPGALNARAAQYNFCVPKFLTNVFLGPRTVDSEYVKPASGMRPQDKGSGALRSLPIRSHCGIAACHSPGFSGHTFTTSK
jgi:hypothetical protein